MISLHLSIQPTFLCNYNCEYCYLGDLRKDRIILDLNILEQRLEEITQICDIENIQILGGEISLLDANYLNDLYNIVNKYPCAMTTNLSNNWLINYCLQNNIKLGVSLNEERPYYQETVNKLKTLKDIKTISLSSVVLPSLLKKSSKEILEFYDSLGFTTYFIQYRPSLTNNVVYDLTLNDYINFMDKLVNEYKTNHYDFPLGNETVMTDTIYSSSYDKSLLINPNGKLNIILENNDGYDYYKELDNIQEFLSFQAGYNAFRAFECTKCKHYNKCLGKHLASSDTKKCSELFNIFDKGRII